MIKFFKHLDIKDKVTLAVALIAAISAVISAVIGISVQKQILECQIAISTCNNNINNLEAKISSINTNVNMLNTYYTEAEKTAKSLMEEAIHAYDAKEYLHVIELYSNDKISNTPVVLTNMGFLYENGYGVIQDFNKAEEYYNKAIFQNYEPAYEHKLAMYIKYKLQNTEEIICEGYDLNNKRAAAYIANFYDTEISDKDAFYTYCKVYSRDEQSEYNQRFYTYISCGEQSFSCIPTNDDFYKYVPTNQKTSLIDGYTVINYYYDVYKCEPLDLNILDPIFIREENL